MGSHLTLLAPFKDNLVRHPISELSFYANKTVRMNLSEWHDALGRIAQGFDNLLQIGDLNPACVVHSPLRFVGCFMAQNSVDPQFPNVRFLVSKLCRDGMAKGMERHRVWQAKSFFMLRESPRKIIPSFT